MPFTILLHFLFSACTEPTDHQWWKLQVSQLFSEHVSCSTCIAFYIPQYVPVFLNALISQRNSPLSYSSLALGNPLYISSIIFSLRKLWGSFSQYAMFSSNAHYFSSLSAVWVKQRWMSRVILQVMSRQGRTENKQTNNNLLIIFVLFSLEPETEVIWWEHRLQSSKLSPCWEVIGKGQIKMSQSFHIIFKLVTVNFWLFSRALTKFVW